MSQQVIRDYGMSVWRSVLDANPVRAFFFFTVLIVVASAWCFWVFTTWPDRYTAGGYFVSLFGFAYVLFELFRSKRIADVARENYSAPRD